MVWHRNSIGLLVQRFFFALIMMSSLLTLQGCAGPADSTDWGDCLVKTCIPMILVLFIVTLKVSKLKIDRLLPSGQAR